MVYTSHQKGTTIWSVPSSKATLSCPTTTKSQTWQNTITTGGASKAIAVLHSCPQTCAVARELESLAEEDVLSDNSTPIEGGNEVYALVFVVVRRKHKYAAVHAFVSVLS